MEANTKQVEIHTDGACLGNPGPGGWAALLRHSGRERELAGGEAQTTNNRMELLAAIMALEALKGPCAVELSTDSQYVQKGIGEWLPNWIRRGWKTAAGEPVKNQDLWLRLQAAAAPHRVQWKWVKGHAGHPDNERVDKLARAEAEKLGADTLRQIVLDTETTGLAWEKGNRIVEIGCIELRERRPTGRHFHRYFNPGREMEPGAQEVTGLTLEFLQDKPRFDSAVEELLEFIAGAELIIHNASFDVGFLNHELSLAGAHFGKVHDHAAVLDTLAMARERWPGQRNSLDALCRRLGVDNGHRKLHGALLDAELLAEVYLGMTSGQGDLGFASAEPAAVAVRVDLTQVPAARPLVLRATEAECAAHAARMEKIAAKSGRRLWPADAPEPAPAG